MTGKNFFFVSLVGLVQVLFLTSRKNEKDKKVKLHFFPRKRIKKCLSFHHHLVFFFYFFIKIKNEVQRELIMHFSVIPEVTATLSELCKPLVARWEFILVKDSGGSYASIKSSSVVVNGKWGIRR